MRKVTKQQALIQFRYVWKVESIRNPDIKGDTVMKREAWNNFVDSLNKEGYVTNSQAFNWSNPF